jgi:hypothetical protein
MQGATLSAFFDNNNTPLNNSLGAHLIVNGENFDGRWMQEDEDYVGGLGHEGHIELGTFTGIDGEYGRLTVGGQAFQGILLQNQENYLNLGGTFTGIDRQYGVLWTFNNNEDVYIGHFDNNRINPQLDIMTRNNEEEYAYGQIDNIDDIMPGVPEGAILSAFVDNNNNNTPLNDSFGAHLIVNGQNYDGRWIEQEQGHRRYVGLPDYGNIYIEGVIVQNEVIVGSNYENFINLVQH